MTQAASPILLAFILMGTTLQPGCVVSSQPRLVEETAEYSFADMAKMAARDTELSESGEDGDGE